MKRILNIGEYIIIFLLGYIIFNFIITVTQVILYGMWGLILDVWSIYTKNCMQLSVIYISLFIICLGINYRYNIYLVNKLNKSLENFKERSVEKEDEK